MDACMHGKAGLCKARPCAGTCVLAAAGVGAGAPAAAHATLPAAAVCVAARIRAAALPVLQATLPCPLVSAWYAMQSSCLLEVISRMPGLVNATLTIPV